MEPAKWSVKFGSEISAMDVSPDGETLVAAGQFGVSLLSTKDRVQTSTLGQGKPATAVIFSPADPHQVFVAEDRDVIQLDRRSPQTAVAKWRIAKEEISQLAIHSSGLLVAVADDSGAVNIIERSGQDIKTRTMKSKHENVCSSVQFRPSTKSKLVSGGLDSTVISWDSTSCKKLDAFNMATAPSPSDTSTHLPSTGMINPPFVFSVAFNGDGTLLSTALGNGGAVLLDCLGEGKLRHRSTLCSHLGPVGVVHFARFDPLNTLLSASDDQHLSLWSSAASAHPKLAHHINVGAKINALQSTVQRNTIFVAPTRSRLLEYTVLA